MSVEVQKIKTVRKEYDLKRIRFIPNVIEKKFLIESINGNLHVIKDLVKKGVDINAQDGQALIFSAENGHLEIIKYLVKNGADIHVQNNEALITSAHNGYLKIVKYLVENGADIHAQNNQVDYSIKLHTPNKQLSSFIIRNRNLYNNN